MEIQRVEHKMMQPQAAARQMEQPTPSWATSILNGCLLSVLAVEGTILLNKVLDVVPSFNEYLPLEESKVHLLSAFALGALFLSRMQSKEQIPSPNEVQAIYTPPRPSEADIAGLAKHAKEIRDLKKNPNVMGLTFAPDARGRLTPIYITCRQDGAKYNFAALRLGDNDPLGRDRLGFAYTTAFLPSNNFLEDFWIGGKPEHLQGYGNSTDRVSKVLLDQVQNDSRYRKIGVILNKAIHQKFAQECNGRIFIDAVRGTHPYHYKMGFRAYGEGATEKNQIYARFVRSHTKPTRDLGSVYMHLPEKALALWQNEVRENPIGWFGY